MTLTLIIGNKNYSSWSLRPWLAMRQFEVAFNEVQIALYTPESRQQIQRYSPAGKVPVLLDGTIAVWDSLAIFAYLVEQFPNLPWLPEAKAMRVIAYSISAEMHSSFQALRHHMPMNCRARLPGKGMTAAVQTDIDRITAIWRECRQLCGEHGSMLFGQFTIADAMFAPVALRFVTYDVCLDAVCSQYVQAILALPAMQDWLKAAEVEAETLPNFNY
ncbi:glutathione S-transferase family protein [Leptolyngbya sp. FACHB-321]|uniref:glutathione S-transferase family protein n=1 Tax=Leptolyngbya sp. FACHB-321 TaxID=2692807 RepID=UPI0016863AE8|nr:glutathione S-transferase family protein [Leptolyngbya sp. FACHB-321]MBD2038606.1 glutathione S-transferase family protein [Leptolyngbya sp. FACHB-321]